ncbi:MAG: hypothetical protein IPP90_07690 [Gemmatimonadaceae bacterium]|nr:hypothetical protein [Gemmatimonadaceae bacterium]
MESTIVNWLTGIGNTAFAWSLGIFLVVNGVAALAFILRRDRALVNRWTGRVLALDLLLLGTGVGVPLMTTMARMTVSVVSASFGASGIGVASVDGAVQLEPTGK